MVTLLVGWFALSLLTGVVWAVLRGRMKQIDRRERVRVLAARGRHETEVGRLLDQLEGDGAWPLPEHTAPAGARPASSSSDVADRDEVRVKRTLSDRARRARD